ncbi:related to Ribosyldihydronicotinamide dehydrogenase [quinone] [Zygosaccharomyces bailii ISA1307]|nr:related to Ribosyldihydronicotinamide dehydrogenase [quinone] [Zygosaccharomyces bailii ISA1307]
MKVLIVFAHPEPRSLSASLRDVAIKHLESQGHKVRVSDLYKNHWKAVLDRDDFGQLTKNESLAVISASKDAYSSNNLTDDVKAEQQKLLWADFVIMQFPLWWFSMPAILKGWVERVFSAGFAYMVGKRTETTLYDRYGEGTFVGKRAMLLITIGGSKENYGPRGVNGPINDVLFPIHHGILFYSGFSVLPPFTLYRANALKETDFEKVADGLRSHLNDFRHQEPIPFRSQNGGDYELPEGILKEQLVAPGSMGFSLHLREKRQ